MAALVSDSQFHVLAVDDSLVDRKLIERLLKISSYQVTVVDSGSKALEFLGLLGDEKENNTSNHHDVEVNLIIADYCMPGMTGYDLLRKIKGVFIPKGHPSSNHVFENVPSRINRCFEQGADDFFLKPVKQSDMNKLVPHLLKGKLAVKDHESANNNTCKRKNTEECLSPEPIRTRYHGSC